METCHHAVPGQDDRRMGAGSESQPNRSKPWHDCWNILTRQLLHPTLPTNFRKCRKKFLWRARKNKFMGQNFTFPWKNPFVTVSSRRIPFFLFVSTLSPWISIFTMGTFSFSIFSHFLSAISAPARFPSLGFINYSSRTRARAYQSTRTFSPDFVATFFFYTISEFPFESAMRNWTPALIIFADFWNLTRLSDEFPRVESDILARVVFSHQFHPFRKRSHFLHCTLPQRSFDSHPLCDLLKKLSCTNCFP